MKPRNLFFAAAVFFSLKAADANPVQASAEDKEEAARKRVYEIVCWKEQQDRQYQRKTRCGCTYNEQQLCDPYMHYLNWQGPIGDIHADTQVAKDIEDAGCACRYISCLCFGGSEAIIVPSLLAHHGIMPLGATAVAAVPLAALCCVGVAGVVGLKHAMVRLPRKWKMQQIANQHVQNHPELPVPKEFPYALRAPGVMIMDQSNRPVPAPAPGAIRRHGASPSDAQPLLDAGDGCEGQTQ